LQREDLNPLETAEAYQMLIQKFSYTHENLATRMGKDRTDITNHLRLLKLPEPIKSSMRNRQLSMGHARTLLAVDNIETQLSMSEKTVKRKLSVRELERIVQNFKKKQLSSNNPGKNSLDTITDNLEKTLSRKFSTKVILKKNIHGSGRIELYYYSHEQFMRLLDVLGISEELT
jgi:ParB family chromosome partitioning protein